ncbi:MAG: PepSY-associated TM helix domain-containing protein [Bacteroidota bacterium]
MAEQKPATPRALVRHHRTDKKPKPAWQKNTASLSRWLHIYLSMVSFAVVLFFSVTGLTLNHADWFGDKEHLTKFKGKMPVEWVNATDTNAIKKLEIVERLRNSHHIKGAVSDFLIEDNQCSLSFKGPGYSADAFVDRKTGEYKLNEIRLGWVAVMNDLHKGRDTGKGWSWVIDASAIFLTLVSVTGLIMLCFMKKKRLSGFIIAAVGLVVCYLLYKILVP